MELLLSQLAEKNDQRTTLGGITRELINDAVAQELQLTADVVRALCINPSFENEYKELATDLFKDSIFNEAIEDGHVTYGMVKPKANEAKGENIDRSDDGVATEVLDAIEQPLTPTIVRPAYMPLNVARGFYDNLRGLAGSDDIFNRVATFMSSSAMTGMVLLGRDVDAIAEWRKQIGATDPQKADEGTIRKRFADEMSNNVAHGSDSVANVKREIGIFRELL